MPGVNHPEATPLHIPEPKRWRSLELEDVDQLSSVIFSESTNPEKWDQSSLRKADHLAKCLGTKLPQSLNSVRDDLALVTLKGRLSTYPDDWNGWPPVEMALCGLYVTENGQVRCFFCDVTFRKLRTLGVCHVKRHKQLAPFCLQLRRRQCGGPGPTPRGKLVRRDSASALHDLQFLTHDQRQEALHHE